MFNTLSSNEAVPKGKKVMAQAIEHRQSHFDLHDPNYNSKFETVNQYFYPSKQREPNTLRMERPNASHFDLAQTKQPDPKHFTSETKLQFSKPENAQKAKQVREKTDLLKSSYNLGDDKIQYTTTNSSEFYDKSTQLAPDPKLRKPERYNIVTNQNMSKEMVQGASNCDFWNQERSKNRTSNNTTDFPSYGVKIDPITNRILPTSKNYFQG